jgi:hypothetical protein
VSGLIRLLKSAQSLIRTGYGDERCVGLLETCITNLLRRYDLPSVGGDSHRVRALVSPQALARLLIYARVEVADELQNPHCAGLLQQCIDRLQQTHWASGKSH